MSPPTPDPVLPLTSAPKIASHILHNPSHLPSELSQATHRIHLVNHWGGPTLIRPGARVLEIGCGQGGSTAVLAEAVGPRGAVDAVDPGAPDYGAPYTLAQAQAHISASAVGGRVAWHRAGVLDFLGGEDGQAADRTWDVAVLAHCVWYFESSRVLEDILRALRGRVGAVCVAEYALRATEPAAVPHVLAALARGALEAHRAESRQNIRTPLSPEAIRGIARKAGWEVESEGVVVPEQGLLDGRWEADMVVGQGFEGGIDGAVDDERVRTLVRSARAATIAAVDAVGGVGKVQTMDVWVSVFREGAE